MRFLVENYPYEVILPTFPEVSACFEFLDFVTAITYDPSKKFGITFLGDVRAVTLWDSEAHLTHRVLSLLNTFLRF